MLREADKACSRKARIQENIPLESSCLREADKACCLGDNSPVRSDIER
jgi:hypothetical protein